MNFVNDEKGDLLADHHRIVNRWKNCLCGILNVYAAGGVRQTEVLFVPEPSASDVEVTIGKFKSYKSPRLDQILAELIETNGGALHFGILKLINFIWNKQLSNPWKHSTVVPVHRKGDKADCSNYRSTLLRSTSYRILSNIILSCIIPYSLFIHSCTGAYSPGRTFGLPFWDFLITHIQTHGKTPLDE
jgi:hypothetical protein